MYVAFLSLDTFVKTLWGVIFYSNSMRALFCSFSYSITLLSPPVEVFFLSSSCVQTSRALCVCEYELTWNQGLSVLEKKKKRKIKCKESHLCEKKENTNIARKKNVSEKATLIFDRLASSKCLHRNWKTGNNDSESYFDSAAHIWFTWTNEWEKKKNKSMFTV